MTVWWFAPHPSAPTGVADYAASLFTELKKHGKLRTSGDASDIPVYHIGNNHLHRPMYEAALRRPGIVVLHDALLHHYYLGSFRQKEYLEEFTYNYGEFSRVEAESLWRDRSLSAQDPRYFERPLLRRIVSGAQAVVVHNRAAARVVREHAPLVPVREIPHFYEAIEPPSPDRIAAFRQQLEVPKNGFVFAIFGYLRESKRLIPILEAFHRLHRLHPETRLLIAGQFVSQDLAKGAHELMDRSSVLILPHLPQDIFNLAAASVDCCLNLRYPTAGETSGIAIRLMGAGKPVVVTEGEEWARFPEEAVFRIPAGLPEREALFQAMSALTLRPDLARQMGVYAALHVQRYHSLSGVGTEYWNFLCHTYASRR